MSDVVLDSSAVLALLLAEPGADAVAEALPDAVLSAVNLGEVLAKLIDRGAPPREARGLVEGLGIQILSHDADQAMTSAALRAETRDLGLSLGDRACLALARTLGVRALTADRAWARLGAPEVEIIR